MMHVKEVAELAGISVRALHYYDEIGLLSPNTNESGYRCYTEQDLEKLQEILFFRELGFPLKQIQEIIHSSTYDRLSALELQRDLLKAKQRRLKKMIQTIEKTIREARGELTMTREEKFAGFDFRDNPYEQEARERWGDEAVNNSRATLAAMSSEEKEVLGEKMNVIYRNLAALRHDSPAAPAAQAAIKQWYEFLNSLGHHYSLTAFRELGRMYVDDERFKKNIDRFGDGLAEFMRDAMEIFARQRGE